MIKFKDLSGWLKTIVVLSWIMAISYAAAFLVGFILEIAAW